MRIEKQINGGILFTDLTSGVKWSYQTDRLRATPDLFSVGRIIILDADDKVHFSIFFSEIQKADLSFCISPDDAIEYLADTFTLDISGGGGGGGTLTGAENGLRVVGTNVRLGGDLIEDTTVRGAHAVYFGEKNAAVTEFGVLASQAISLQAQDPNGFCFATIQPSFWQIINNPFASIGSKGFRAEDITAGITVIDSADAKGLVGDANYSANYDDLTYVQKIYVDALTSGGLIPVGNWDSLANTPTLTSGVSPGGQFLYFVSVGSSGVTNLDGFDTFNVGDIVYWADLPGQWYRVGTSFSAQNLQQVTDVGNITNNTMSVQVGTSINTMTVDGMVISHPTINQDAQFLRNGIEINNLITSRSFIGNTVQGYQHISSSGNLEMNLTHERRWGLGFDVTRLQQPFFGSITQYYPTGNGTLALSVDGNFADAAGNISTTAGQNNETKAVFFDDFIYAPVVGTYFNSILKWNTTANTRGMLNSELNAPGIVRITTTTTSGNFALFHLWQANNFGVIAAANLSAIEFRVRYNSLTDIFAAIGASQNWAVAPANTMYFRATTGDVNWQAVHIGISVNTTIDTGVPIAAGVWVKFRIERDPTECRYFIDGNLVATVTTNLIPDNILLNPGVYGQTLSATQKIIDMDYAKISVKATR